MQYSVRYAHLKEQALIPLGEVAILGKKIAIAGNTGASDGAHLHIDCIEGVITRGWKLSETERRLLQSSPKQLNYFIDDGLFSCPPRITTPYCDYEYMKNYKKLHHAYDVVPADGKSWSIYWNRSKTGTVVVNEYDESYGWMLIVRFDA